ncbi:MAG: hypothetical protein Q9160_008799 [Pyrenula sp. 1 TL-2023]
MASTLHSSANDDSFLEHQPDRWISSVERQTGFTAQEIPETQPPVCTISSASQDEDLIAENVHTADTVLSTTTRKGRAKSPRSVGKKLKERTERSVTMDDESRLAAWIEAAEQDLESEREKVRVLEEQISTLKEARAIIVNRREAQEEIIGSGDGPAAAQDQNTDLAKNISGRDLLMAILANVIQLSRLSGGRESEARV